MKSKLKLWFKAAENKSVASRQRWLYAYAVTNLLALAYNYVKELHTPLPAPAQSPYFSTSEIHAFLIQGLVFGAALEIAAMTYLVTARKVKHVLVFMYILLSFNILALTNIFFFKPSLLRSVITIVQLCFTAVMIKLLRGIKREDAKLTKAPKRKAKATIVTEPEGSKGWRITRKVIRVLFRVNSVFYGLYLIWAGALLLQFEHDRLTIVRLFIPFVVLGLLYMFPYYLLKSKQLVVYVGAFLLVTALTILSLHIPVHVGRYAPAYLPLPPRPDFFWVIVWAFFHLSPAFVVYGFLICFDATARWTKQIVRAGEDRRAAVTIFWVLLFAGSLALGGVVRTHTATQTAQAVPQQLVTFTSSKYKFGINFPEQPSTYNGSLQPPQCGNEALPYAMYSSTDFTVYAFSWPKQDTDFSNMDQSALKTTLDNFMNIDMQTLNGGQNSTDMEHLFSGHSLAEEAQFTIPEKNQVISGYDRIFTIGNFQYDIIGESVGKTVFDSFANSFQFTGSNGKSVLNNGSGTGNTACVYQNTDQGTTSSAPTDQPTADSTDSSSTDSSTQSNGIPDNATLQLQ